MGTTDESTRRESAVRGIEEGIRLYRVELRQLVECGCVRRDLMYHLAVLHQYDPRVADFRFWTGLSRDQLRRAVTDLEQCATLIESLNSGAIKAVLAGPTGLGRAPLFLLPETIRTYTGALRDILAEVSKRKHLVRDLLLARLVDYVQSRTGDWHDRQVAALVGAVLGKTYSAENHQQWRRVNYSRLAGILQQFADR